MCLHRHHMSKTYLNRFELLSVDEMRRKSDDIPDLAASNKMKDDGIDNVSKNKLNCFINSLN